MTTESGRVVVGVSGSLASLAALRRGVLEARRDGRTLVAVAAWEPPEGETLYAKWPDRAWVRMWEDEARLRLNRAFDEAIGGLPADLHVTCLVIRNAPGSALCAVARRHDDLLIVGAARPNGLRARTHRNPVRRQGEPQFGLRLLPRGRRDAAATGRRILRGTAQRAPRPARPPRRLAVLGTGTLLPLAAFTSHDHFACVRWATSHQPPATRHARRIRLREREPSQRRSRPGPPPSRSSCCPPGQRCTTASDSKPRSGPPLGSLPSQPRTR
ncbi:universal stress protein [Streptomyces shenzhenensis]|uniref:universal stress protein n=1 Tax=Streptomyces shenzhenensis TaxID=943815 RepID=UPI001F459457|nr:universal stress protein [Streptomyces shenzhenensis]